MQGAPDCILIFVSHQGGRATFQNFLLLLLMFLNKFDLPLFLIQLLQLGAFLNQSLDQRLLEFCVLGWVFARHWQTLLEAQALLHKLGKQLIVSRVVSGAIIILMQTTS